MPSRIGAIGWILLAGPNSGFLNQAWRALTGAEQPLLNIYSFPGLALVIALIALVLWRRAPVPAPDGHAVILSPLRFGLIVVTTAALFNVAMVHVGTTVLFTLPAWIPLLGGPWTLEAPMRFRAPAMP